MDGDGKDSLARTLGRGALAGLAGTAAMSLAMLAAKKTGLLGKVPPKKITQATLRALGLPRAHRRDDLVTSLAHVGYGMGGGGLFALLARQLRRRQVEVSRSVSSRVLAGAAFGVGVWALSYAGWVPALGIMAPPHRDRPGRPTSMVLAHLIYGAVVGAAASPRDTQSSSGLRLRPPAGAAV
jgi:hypothetical protein